MNAFIKSAVFGVVVLGSVLSTGCTTLDNLHAAAVAEREVNPEKYTEIPEVQRQQYTPNTNGPTYQQSCAFGCPAEQFNTVRNW